MAIGIALDSCYSALIGRLATEDFQRIMTLLTALKLPTSHPLLNASDSNGRLLILEGLEEFRQHLGGELTVTLLEGLGRGFETHEIDANMVVRAVQQLTQKSAAPKTPGH